MEIIQNERGIVMNYNKINKQQENINTTNKRENVDIPSKREDPTLESPKPITATVTSRYRLNVRKEASVESEILTTLDPGQVIKVDLVTKEWTHIWVDHLFEGYVMTKYIKINEE